MDSLSKKIQNLGIHDIRNAARFAQNVIVQYEPYQVDIRRATNTDAWGPTPKHLAKVIRNRYQVPLYLMTEYILKRLVDHIAQRPKNFYEKARKDYVNYGAEWRVVLKCLVVIEFLLLNVDDGDELNQIRSCLATHKHILSKEVIHYKIKFSNDGKMEVHERGIRKKGEEILQYLDDPQYLKKTRLKNKKNALKIRQQSESTMYDTNYIGGPRPVAGSTSFSGDHITDADFNDFDDDDDDDFSEDNVNYNANDVNNNTERRRTTLEEQRRQRREILRDRIKKTELNRKNSLKQQRQQQQAKEEIPDLLDLDFDTPVTTSTTSAPVTPALNNDDDDDDFGDFQSDASPIASTTQQTSKSTPVSPSVTAPTSTNNTATLDDLLNFGDSAPSTTANTTKANQKKDVFADLLANSKSLI